MVFLTRNAPSLLRVVGGAPHATSEDHEQRDQQAASDLSDDDDDDDLSSLGALPKRIPKNVRPPPRKYTRPVGSQGPAKREAESGDELTKGPFSQSSQPKRLKTTFSRKFGTQNQVVRQQEKTASSFKARDGSTLQAKPPEPPRKKTFRAIPSAETSSSQPEAPSVASAPSFRQPTRSAMTIADSTDLSAQSQPITLDSSQLSPPPSSPISSLCDIELAQEADQLDKHLSCPICGMKVEKDFWDKFQDEISYKRMNLRLQERFCQAHKARSADDVWTDRGYPKIDWSALQGRLKAHHRHIHAVLDGHYESHYYKQHAKMVSSTKGYTARSAVFTGHFTGLRAGYYGTKGEKIMAEDIVRTFSDKLRTLSETDPLIASGSASGGMSGFVHAILVPEMACGLIMEDMKCDRDTAQDILADSADIGEMFNEEEDEEMPRVEIDLLDPSEINDETEVLFTQRPGKKFRLV
ncbi:hypothetical protein E4T38_04242 [Aureobasidium subglaciale]|nr:hypothetical protein E4T38_04242 [Aureobasidium subglaciale]